MKHLLLVGFILLTGLACSPEPEAEIDAVEVEAAVRRFYDYISSYDYAQLREASAADFEILAAGRRMDTGEFESWLREMEARGDELTLDLSEFNTDGAGDVAYTSLVESGSGSVYFESFILRRSGDRWLVERVTSSEARQDNP